MANYERINWEDYPSTDTPLDSENLNKMDAAIDAINREVQQAREDIEENTDQVELAHNRIDSLIALPDGSTTADAELVDGRIGYDNTQYNSLGAAIRGQVEDLHNVLEDATDELNERLDDVKSATNAFIVYGKKPNISTANSTLTIYNDTTLAIGNKRYYPAVGSDVVVDLTTASSDKKKILFKTSNSTFRCINWDVIYSITADEVIFCYVWLTTNVCLLSCNFDYTVDGDLPFIPEIITSALGASEKKSVSQNTLTKYINSTGNITIVPTYNLLPNIDTKNKVIDFGGGTQLYIGKNRYSLGSGYRSVSLVKSGSSANYQKLVFDVSTSTFSALEYAESISATQVVIGTVNLNESYKYIENAEFPFKYTLDGVLPNKTCEPTRSARLNKFIRGLYLRGIDKTKTYFISTVRHNTSANLFYLLISVQNDGSTTEVTAYKGTSIPKTRNEIITLSQSNNSGITGYAYVNWDALESNTYVETASSAGLTTINSCCYEVESFPALFNYYQEYETDTKNLEIKLRNTVRQAKAVDGAQTFGLLWFSDVHGSIINLKRIMEFKANHANLITDVIHTGDSIRNLTSDSFDFWDESNAGSVLNVIGNHDVWIGVSNYADAEYAYNRYFAPYIDDWGVTYTENKCYYYKDYSAYNIRLIVLDNMHWDTDQLTWLTTTLSGASSKHVIIAMHYQPFVSTDVPERTGWNAMFTSDETANRSINEAVQTFVNGGGTFVCYITGHMHFDKLGKLTGRNELSVVISTASYTAGQDSYRILTGESCDLFNVLCVDTTYGVLKILRCGNKINSALQRKEYLAYDYIHGQYITID